MPRRADGRPYGSEVRQLTRDPAAWNQWLAEHAGDFDPGFRYRRGALYGPSPLFECLTSRVVPLELRRLAYEELVARYGCPEPFEPDDFVVDQIASLRRIAHWMQQNEARFEHSRGAFERAGLSYARFWSATAVPREIEDIVPAQYILAMLGCAFLIAAAIRRARHGPGPQSRTWLLVGGIFAAVSLWLFVRG